MRQDMSVQVSAKEDSWGTPSHIAARVRNVFGGIIDLDAASSVESNAIIQANRIFTVDDNALTKDWIAENVFLNPPYGKVGNASKAGLFAQKAIEEYKKGHFKEGIILLHSRFGG
jgi:site-specific DNA-methyltransferase (adenine-specific)